MMGMAGSRGDAPAQATALATLFEIAALLRNADKILPESVAALNQSAAEARTAHAELEKASAEHNARAVVLQTRDSALAQAAASVADREKACQDREAETQRQQEAFDVQTTMLAARALDLDRREGKLRDALEAFQAETFLHAANQEAATKAAHAEIDRQRTASAGQIKDNILKAEAEINEMRAKAQADVMAAQEILQKRQAAIAAREEAMRAERARMSALLQD